jgi:hypothetical protein
VKPVESLEEARKVVDTTEKIKTGIIYIDNSIPTFYEQLENRKGIKTELVEEVKHMDISKLLEQLH